jgi:phosphatidylinositol 4-kinase
MQEMVALEEERVERMRENHRAESIKSTGMKGSEDEHIIRGELKKEDPSAIVFNEPWAVKKVRRRSGPIYRGNVAQRLRRVEYEKAHLMGISVRSLTRKAVASTNENYSASWDCVSVIVKTGGDLRQEQLACTLIRQFQKIWELEKVQCWVKS